MTLPVPPPVLPMLAKRSDHLPDGDGWIFEPKWDGFRAIVFRDGDDVLVQSREGKPLDRYFPELAPRLRQALPESCVVDGELVVARGGGLDFDALQQRLHPAASRAARLAQETPAEMVVWDILCEGRRDLRHVPFAARRARLEALLDGRAARLGVHLTPATGDRTRAQDWFERFEGAGLDGVIAKRADGPYEADQRVMIKVKHARECDCLVAGLRWHHGAEGKAVGSLLLGLYDPQGVLQHVGAAASFPMETRISLATRLSPLRVGAAEGHPWLAPQARDGQRVPGAPSRWSRGKDTRWEPLRPELVVEVAYDHMQGDRFRHLTQLRRLRDDRSPRSCTYAQLEVVPPAELRRIFARESDNVLARNRGRAAHPSSSSSSPSR